MALALPLALAAARWFGSPPCTITPQAQTALGHAGAPALPDAIKTYCAR